MAQDIHKIHRFVAACIKRKDATTTMVTSRVQATNPAVFYFYSKGGRPAIAPPLTVIPQQQSPKTWYYQFEDQEIQIKDAIIISHLENNRVPEAKKQILDTIVNLKMVQMKVADGKSPWQSVINIHGSYINDVSEHVYKNHLMHRDKAFKLAERVRLQSFIWAVDARLNRQDMLEFNDREKTKFQALRDKAQLLLELVEDKNPNLSQPANKATHKKPSHLNAFIERATEDPFFFFLEDILGQAVSISKKLYGKTSIHSAISRYATFTESNPGNYDLDRAKESINQTKLVIKGLSTHYNFMMAIANAFKAGYQWKKGTTNQATGKTSLYEGLKQLPDGEIRKPVEEVILACLDLGIYWTRFAKGLDETVPGDMTIRDLTDTLGFVDSVFQLGSLLKTTIDLSEKRSVLKERIQHLNVQMHKHITHLLNHPEDDEIKAQLKLDEEAIRACKTELRSLDADLLNNTQNILSLILVISMAVSCMAAGPMAPALPLVLACITVAISVINSLWKDGVSLWKIYDEKKELESELQHKKAIYQGLTKDERRALFREIQDLDQRIQELDREYQQQVKVLLLNLACQIFTDVLKVFVTGFTANLGMIAAALLPTIFVNIMDIFVKNPIKEWFKPIPIVRESGFELKKLDANADLDNNTLHIEYVNSTSIKYEVKGSNGQRHSGTIDISDFELDDLTENNLLEKLKPYLPLLMNVTDDAGHTDVFERQFETYDMQHMPQAPRPQRPQAALPAQAPQPLAPLPVVPPAQPPAPDPSPNDPAPTL